MTISMTSALESAVRDLLKEVVRDVLREVLPPRPANASELPPKDARREPMLLRASEAARMLAISQRHLFTLSREGEIPCVRHGHLVRYSLDTIREWIRRTESMREPGLAPDSTRRPAGPDPNDTGRRARKARSTATGADPAPKKTKGHAAPSPPKPPVPAAQKQRASVKQEENRPRNIVALMAARLGVQEDDLPRMTYGEIRRIAEVDTPTLHGWTYHNREMPEAAFEKLHDYFVAYLAEKK